LLFSEISIESGHWPDGQKLEARGKGEQRNVARLLDRERDATLVAGADAGETARNDLAARRGS